MRTALWRPAFLHSLVALAREQRLGPLVDRRQRAHVHEHVTEVAADGASLLLGGRIPDGPGAFYPATVLTGCTPSMRIMREDTFGPVAPVRVIDDFERAVAEAADDYELAATVPSRRFLSGVSNTVQSCSRPVAVLCTRR